MPLCIFMESRWPSWRSRPPGHPYGEKPASSDTERQYPGRSPFCWQADRFPTHPAQIDEIHLRNRGLKEYFLLTGGL